MAASKKETKSRFKNVPFDLIFVALVIVLVFMCVFTVYSVEKHESYIMESREGTWTQVNDLDPANYNMVDIDSTYVVFYKFYPEYGTYEFVDFGNYEEVNDYKVVVNDKVLAWSEDYSQMTYGSNVLTKREEH